jgi:hypothetical protein
MANIWQYLQSNNSMGCLIWPRENKNTLQSKLDITPRGLANLRLPGISAAYDRSLTTIFFPFWHCWWVRHSLFCIAATNDDHTVPRISGQPQIQSPNFFFWRERGDSKKKYR